MNTVREGTNTGLDYWTGLLDCTGVLGFFNFFFFTFQHTGLCLCENLSLRKAYLAYSPPIADYLHMPCF